MLIHLDGRLVPSEQATVSVFDHGFLYGDGVFEGIRCYGGNVFRLREHVARLYESARTLKIEIPLSQDEMVRAVAETVAANERPDAYIRVVVSRGKGDLGIDPGNCPRPSVVIVVADVVMYPPEVYDYGLSVVTSSVRRIPLESLDPRVKSLNYLNNILAKMEAKNAGCPEAIMLNHQGYVAECTGDNLFIVKNGLLRTPDVTQGCLAGITRSAVLDIARRCGIAVSETVLGLHDVYNADECFLTGTAAEVAPVVSVDGRTIGDGTPGPFTRWIADEFRHLRRVDGVEVDFEGGRRKKVQQELAGVR
jgi:branched-chain amino acid aminotransferase